MRVVDWKQPNNHKPENSQPDQPYWNNLYGSAFQFPLPFDNYRELTQTEIGFFQKMFDKIKTSKEIDDIFDPSKNSGYIFTCNMSFNKQCQNYTCNFPIAIEHKVIDEEMLTKDQRINYEKVYEKKFKPMKCMNFNYGDKVNYTSLGILLAYYCKLGATVKLVGGFTFKQFPIAKTYVDKCCELRSKSTSDFKTKLFKNMTQGCILYPKVKNEISFSIRILNILN